MNGQDVTSSRFERSAGGAAYRAAYSLIAYFGLFSVFGSLLFGFRFDAGAPGANFGVNLLVYGLFIAPHLIMTRAWFKQRVWGHPAGLPRERRFYILTTVATWFALLALHRPVPGPALDLPAWANFAGVVLFLMSFKLFFEGVSLDAINGLLGVPGAVSAYSHGATTPLFTEGPYSQVRHPMYRAYILAALASLLIHPDAGQLFWTAILAATFLAFIPIEEAQLIRARGADYLAYRQRTPWRVFPGIW